MKKVLLIAAVFGICCTSQAAGVSWLRDYRQALTLAKREHKLVMIDFYTGWCKWCKVLDAKTYPSAPVVRASGQFISLKLDAEKEGVAQANRFGVHAFPTILFLREDQLVLHRVEGYRPPDQFLQEMKAAQTMRQRASDLAKKVALTPNDAKLRSGYAVFLAHGMDFPSAERELAVATRLTHGQPDEYIAYGALMIGEGYATSANLAHAIPFFEQAIAATKQSRMKAHAMVELGASYMDSKQPAKASSVLHRVFQLPDVTNEDRTAAQNMLKAAGG